MGKKKFLLLLHPVALLFMLEGVYYAFRMLMTLLTAHRLVVDIRLICIPIGVALLSRKKVWRLMALVYVSWALIAGLYTLRAILFFVSGPVVLTQIVGLPIYQPTPKAIVNLLLMILALRVYQFVILLGTFFLPEFRQTHHS